VASKVQIATVFIDWIFQVALVSSSITVFDYKLIPIAKELVLIGIGLEDIIVVILSIPING
jgi:hypothetical protein